MSIPIQSSPLPLQGKCVQCKNSAGTMFEFDHAFQPIVDVSMRNIFGHEALVRGPSGEDARSVLSQVDDGNRYAFDQACRVSAIRGAAQLAMPGMLSINFMPNAVYRPEACIQTTLTAAREFGFPIENIIFETTENEKVIDKKFLIEILSEYKRFGFRTAIDDFGAGYAGLDLLADFQPDIIKIDMELVRGIDSNRARQIIVNSVLDMCTLLDIEIIAEGIETHEEYRCLADLGIAYMQGFYFSRPQFRALGIVDPAAW
ncbi:MAG: EAL domain-containing protein [Herminiimonas sp.]|nr:EAL domain-containing protein [Herminiimonas sp.]